MISDNDIWDASEKEFPYPEQKPHRAPPDQRERDMAQDLQSAFERGAEWMREKAVQAVVEAFKEANDAQHDSLCACSGYPESCVTYPNWAYVEVDRLHQEDILAALGNKKPLLTSEGLEKRPEADFDIATGKALGEHE